MVETFTTQKARQSTTTNPPPPKKNNGGSCSSKNQIALRITGPCSREVWVRIARVWDLQTTSFEILWVLGVVFCLEPWTTHGAQVHWMGNVILSTVSLKSSSVLEKREQKGRILGVSFLHPWRLTWKRWFGRWFSSSRGVFSGPMLIFRGVHPWKLTWNKPSIAWAPCYFFF